MIEINLPEIRIKPQIQAVYDDGLTHTRNGHLALVQQELDWEPTFDNAKRFMDEFIPHQFHHTVDFVEFRADQPVDKMHPDIMHLDDNQTTHTIHGFAFSYTAMTVYWNDLWHIKTLGKQHIKASSKRTHSNQETHHLYIKT